MDRTIVHKPEGLTHLLWTLDATTGWDTLLPGPSVPAGTCRDLENMPGAPGAPLELVYRAR